jgi:hypothetical protein
MNPIGYVGDPDDIAYGVLCLASKESKFMASIALVIDGGYAARQMPLDGRWLHPGVEKHAGRRSRFNGPGPDPLPRECR